MVLMGFEHDNGPIVNKFIDAFSYRIKSIPFVDGEAITKGNKAIFHIRPLVWPIYWIGIMIWVSGFIAGLSKPAYLVAGLIPFLTVLFYMRSWYVLLLYIGLRKAKYRGKLRML